MARTKLRYRWRYFDPIQKKHCTTRYHATEQAIRQEHPDAAAMPGTEQVLELADEVLSDSMARFQIGATDP